MNDHEKWMRIAIEEANLAKNINEVPVGAVIVKNGKLLSKAHNQMISNNDSTAHAEIQAIRKACASEKNYRLVASTLYVTLEPCTMCLGAIIHSRISRVIFGASDFKSGVCGSCADLTLETFFNHKVEVVSGVLEGECKELLQSFFRLLR